MSERSEKLSTHLVTGVPVAFERRVSRLEAHHVDQVAQLKEMHRDLRAVQTGLHRLIDDWVPLKLLLERAVSVAERLEERISDASTSKKGPANAD